MKKIFTLISIVALFATQVLSQCIVNDYTSLQSCFSQTGTVNITLTANITLSSDLTMTNGTTYNITVGSFDIARNGKSYVGGDASTKIVVGSANVRNDNTGAYTINGLNASPSLRGYVIILKVEMLYFNGQSVKGGVRLNWATSDETNSSHFLLERSIDAKNWQLLSSIKTNNKASVYRYYDASNLSAYYRLSEVSSDGKVEVFKAIYVEKESKGLQVFPNPSNGTATIVSEKTVDIFNALGQKVGSMRTGQSNFTDLKKGLYVLKTDSESVKFVVQ